MPCDTIQITTLDVEKMRPDLLQKALESMGYEAYEHNGRVWASRGGEYLEVRNGRLTVAQGRAADELQANLQKAYSREVVSESAKRAGFKVQKTADYQLKLTRGY